MSVEVRQELHLPGALARFRFAGHTDRGPVRPTNEDSFLAKAPFFVVADGMGGHALGDRASQAAIAAFADALPLDAPARPQEVLDTIARANDAVLALGTGIGLSGTTLTGVAFVDLDGRGDCRWMVFNIGDSRTYAWDGRSLAQLTVDHSAVQELIDLGDVSPEAARRHPQRNVVTRALGAEDRVEPDAWLLPAQARQTFLVCSDGLTKELDDEEIARIIVFHDAESARDRAPTLAERLVGAALAAGGTDNATVVVVELELAGAAEAAEDTLDRPAGVLEDTRPRG